MGGRVVQTDENKVVETRSVKEQRSCAASLSKVWVQNSSRKKIVPCTEKLGSNRNTLKKEKVWVQVTRHLASLEQR
jgi:hypothetical protein